MASNSSVVNGRMTFAGRPNAKTLGGIMVPLEAHYLAGRDVFEAVQVSVNPKVIEIPMIGAVAKKWY